MTKETGIIEVSWQIIKVFQQKRGQCWKKRKTDKENIENCFLLCNKYWERLRILVSEHEFISPEEEILFFRQLKPTVTADIEYYSLLCQADMFLPDGPETQVLKFWEREFNRLKEFVSRHHVFFNYYKSGRSDLDKLFFRRKDGHNVFPQSKIYFEDNRSATGYDHLLASIIAHERYNAYAEERLAHVRKKSFRK